MLKKYGLEFLVLQRLFDGAAENGNIRDYLYDVLHPNIAGARLIADEWIKIYNKKIKNI